jgi:CPA1 family monovalent cation:H+ antiporter
MDPFLSAEAIVIVLLLTATLVALAVRRLRVPYTVALVIVGLLISVQAPLKLAPTPSLILGLLLPPLVFEAAFHINITELGRSVATIAALAVPGVIVTMLIVGGLVAGLTSLSLPAALVFGALIANTDPVAVVALFRTVGVPKRLTVLLESESLLNDGTGIVLFNLVLAVALTGQFSLLHGLAAFVVVAGGGTLIGLALGWVTAQLIARIDDYLIETTLTTVLAFGSYLVAEQWGVSGVLAVVAAGLVMGHLGPRGMSPTTRIVLHNFWEYVAFLANSAAFLLIGLQVSVAPLAANWRIVVVAVAAVLLARGVVIYGFTWILNHWVEPIPLPWQHVLTWGGLRGAINLALALSLPAALGAGREALQLMTFGVVLFTLLAQATTMSPLVRRLGITGRSRSLAEYEAQHARLIALRAAGAHLDRMHADGLLSSPTWEKLKAATAERAAPLAEAVRAFLRAEPALEAAELEDGWREALRAQRAALLDLQRDGLLSEEVFARLAAELDEQLSGGFTGGAAGSPPRTQFVELAVSAASPAEARSLAELGLPREAVLVSVRRGSEVILPRGDTRFAAGDVVMLLCEPASVAAVNSLFRRSP